MQNERESRPNPRYKIMQFLVCRAIFLKKEPCEKMKNFMAILSSFKTIDYICTVKTFNITRL